jgi:hypothetical protein
VVESIVPTVDADTVAELSPSPSPSTSPVIVPVDESSGAVSGMTSSGGLLASLHHAHHHDKTRRRTEQQCRGISAAALGSGINRSGGLLASLHHAPSSPGANWAEALGLSSSEDEGEPSGRLNDAPCPPWTSHGASIRQPFGAAEEEEEEEVKTEAEQLLPMKASASAAAAVPVAVQAVQVTAVSGPAAAGRATVACVTPTAALPRPPATLLPVG